ncbi:MAG: CehA/McbA family metallohydrolase [Planctomycetota bacterium]
MIRRLLLLMGCWWIFATGTPSLAWAAKGRLEIQTLDQTTGKPVAVRMHLRDAKGKTVKPPKVPNWHDHFVFNGKVVLELSPGQYTFTIERGLEYRDQTGYFTVESGASDSKVVELRRYVDMKKEGWWSGDLHLQRSPADLPTLMLAEDLHVAPVLAWGNDSEAGAKKTPPSDRLVTVADDRFFQAFAGRDRRPSGSLLYFNLAEPLAIQGVKGEAPAAVEFLKVAKKQPNAHVDIQQPFAWDLPMWIASRRIDSIGLINSHLQRDGVTANEGTGKPRDTAFYPNPQGNGRWSLDIYYHLLNCGLRLPPTAGSGSGEAPNPVGYNRVYVHCGDDFTWEKWWEGLRAGRVLVTNGPLLRPLVNEQLPGYIFQAYAGEKLELNVALNLSMREKIEYLEVVKNGRVVHEARLDDWIKKEGRLPLVEFEESGWMLVRAVTNNPQTMRYAMSAPYYVQFGDRPRISRKSAQFFLDWCQERIQQLEATRGEDVSSVLRYHEAAREYWSKLVANATTD